MDSSMKGEAAGVGRRVVLYGASESMRTLRWVVSTEPVIVVVVVKAMVEWSNARVLARREYCGGEGGGRKGGSGSQWLGRDNGPRRRPRPERKWD